MHGIQVAVQASDPVTLAGISTFLDQDSAICVLPRARRAQADVLVVAVDRLSGTGAEILGVSAKEFDLPTVLIAGEVKEDELLVAVECRVVAILSRTAAGDDRLPRAVKSAAAGGASIPPDLLGRLLRHVERLQLEVLAPEGLTMSGLAGREVAVLRLLADGMETREVARELCYSERTVKNIIYSITNRFQLRNRQHAVAYAVRAGII